MGQIEDGRYVGRIGDVRSGYCFIGRATVSTTHGDTITDLRGDIFLHRNDCDEALRDKLTIGLLVSFEVENDESRGDGYLRAIKASEAPETALLPAPEVEVLPGLLASNKLPEITEPPAYLSMKDVSQAVVNQARANKPLEDLPPDSTNGSTLIENDEDLLTLFESYLRHLFPALQSVINDFGITGYDEAQLDTAISGLTQSYQEMEMGDQSSEVEQLYLRFKETRRLLTWIHEQDLLKPGSQISPLALGAIVELVEDIGTASEKTAVIDAAQQTIEFMLEHGIMQPNALVPNDKLVELFTAVPVWYWALGDEMKEVTADLWKRDDPMVSKNVQFICSLYPDNPRFAHFFQMFNRRLRGMNNYLGEIIPAKLMRVIAEAKKTFDYVVICTPYHDVAGRDWQDLKWLRAIDPYVIGFKKGLPCFFVLGRFSDQGIFPHLNELVADTICFLQANRDKLAGFNITDQPYWLDICGSSEEYNTGNGCYRGERHKDQRLGDFLMNFTDQLITAFQQGVLFDWLRCERDLPVAEIEEASK